MGTGGIGDAVYYMIIYQSSDQDLPISHIVNYVPYRGSFPTTAKLSKRGVYIYGHTVNELKEFEDLKKYGVHGIYTDRLFPPCPALS